MQPSHLFTVRLWRARVGGGREEWRGVVQHVLTRETFTFRTWNDLVAHLVSVTVKDDITEKSKGGKISEKRFKRKRTKNP